MVWFNTKIGTTSKINLPDGKQNAEVSVDNSDINISELLAGNSVNSNNIDISRTNSFKSSSFDFGASKEKLAQAQTKFNNLQERYNKAASALTEPQRNIMERQNEVELKIAGIDEKINSITSKISSIDNSIIQVDNNIATFNDKISYLSEQNVPEAQTGIEIAKNKISELTAKKKELENNKKEQEAILNNFSKEKTELSKERLSVAQNQDENNLVPKDIQELSSSLAQAKIELANAQAAFEQAKNASNNTSDEEIKKREKEIETVEKLTDSFYKNKINELAKGNKTIDFLSSSSVSNINENLTERKQLIEERKACLEAMKELKNNPNSISQDEYEQLMNGILGTKDFRNAQEKINAEKFNPGLVSTLKSSEKLKIDKSNKQNEEEQNNAINTLDQNWLNAVNERGDFGLIKQTLDVSIVDLLGTSSSDVNDKAMELNKKIEQLYRTKDNPEEFCKSYKDLTGVDYDAEKIKAVKEKKEAFEQVKTVKSQYDTLTNPKIKQVLDDYEKNPEIKKETKLVDKGKKATQTIDKITPLKNITLETYAKFSGISIDEAQKSIEDAYNSNIEGDDKTFKELSYEEKGAVYYLFLKNLTSEKMREDTKTTLNTLSKGKDIESIEYEYDSALEAAFGKNELADMVKKNSVQTEIAYQGTKFIAITAATIASGGMAGAAGYSGMALNGINAFAGGSTSLAIGLTETSTDSDGLTSNEFNSEMVSAASIAANIFAGGAIGQAEENLFASGAIEQTTSKLLGSDNSKIFIYGIKKSGEGLANGTTAYMIDQATGSDETWGNEVNYALGTGFAMEMLGNAASQFGSIYQNINNNLPALAKGKPKIYTKPKAKSAIKLNSKTIASILRGLKEKNK